MVTRQYKVESVTARGGNTLVRLVPIFPPGTPNVARFLNRGVNKMYVTPEQREFFQANVGKTVSFDTTFSVPEEE